MTTRAQFDLSAPRLAPALNAACQCIWLDRDKLRAQLVENLGEAGDLLESRPGLASGSVVFVDPQEADSMDRTARLVHRALSSPAYMTQVQEHAPPIARVPGAVSGGVLGFDFHLGGSDPQLIEINTNPGGLLVNLELARALTACCDHVAGPMARLVSGNVPPGELPSHVVAGFREEWTRARGDAPLTTVAIVDDDPLHQYLHPEFVLYRNLFEQAGWHARIVDAAGLEVRNGELTADRRRIDLVYNRATDFYFAEERHSALKRAYEDGLVVITPHPAAHAHWADKRLLAWLRDDAMLGSAGLDAHEREHLLRTIPPTEIVTRDAADQLWRRRKELFFKPIDGYGSKAAYRGDKLTRSTFEHVLSHRYVAQAIAPTSTRRVVTDGRESELRVDLRNYCSQGETWLRAARLYRGQTTNFRTPGGGFAPVLTLPR
jgi:glutathione synthase/RimK-type ligase-like ATP-grasp enzyme